MKALRPQKKTLRYIAPLLPALLCLWLFFSSGFVLPESQLAFYWFPDTGSIAVTPLLLTFAKLSFYLPLITILYASFWLILALLDRLLQFFHRQTPFFYGLSGAILSLTLYLSLSLSLALHSKPRLLQAVLVITVSMVSPVLFAPQTKRHNHAEME